MPESVSKALRRESIPVKSCNFFEYSDLIDVVFSKTESEYIAEELNNSEISFGENNRTMVSIGRFCDLIREVEFFEPDQANAIIERLNEIAEPTDYIDVEN